MRLLITTQAVDLDDPVLEFFHSWIAEFAKHCESVTVICLKEGRHTLPDNVRVYSLGKESGATRLQYIAKFYRYIWSKRYEYDAVFAHMNSEYVVLGGLVWRLLGKKIGLWYIHPKARLFVRLAVHLVNFIFSATTNSFPLKSEKLKPMGIGIDTNFFAPDNTRIKDPGVLRIAHVARIAPVKNVACMIDAVQELSHRGISATFDHFGGSLPRDAGYVAAMKEKTSLLTPGIWTWRGETDQNGVLQAYRTHDVQVNATTSGSFDKAVFEGMACGCLPITSNTALFDVVPKEMQFKEGDAISLADTLERISQLSTNEFTLLSKRMTTLAQETYSLSSLIGRILATYHD